jgi:hypothetical protein
MSSEEGTGGKKEPGRPELTLEQFIDGLVEGILEVQRTLAETGNKFMEIAEKQKQDQFKKDVADAIVGINYTVFQTLVDIGEVYRVAFLDRERLKLSYEIIDMLVPYIAHNSQTQEQEIREKIKERSIALEKRLAKLRQYPNRKYRRST